MVKNNKKSRRRKKGRSSKSAETHLALHGKSKAQNGRQELKDQSKPSLTGSITSSTPLSRGSSMGKKRRHEQLSHGDTGQSKPSLAQLLKKHRGVAAKTAPPPIWMDKSGRQRNFLMPQHDPRAFEDCLKTSFSGFHHDSPESLPSNLHREFDSSFSGIEKGGLFLYDTVQPGKKRLIRTSVTRTLVGDPGSTYKYLGLRLFSHPWVDVDENGNSIEKDTTNGSTLRKLGYDKKTASALINMGLINRKLTERSKTMLDKHVSPNISPVGLVGSAEFNLTLINKMESSTTKRDLKKEVGYGMGKISVGWHRDSGLKDFSTIAVYQTVKDLSSPISHHSWGVALRAMDGGAGGPLASIPPLLVPLPSGSLYFMLDDFNHNHEHAVVAGSSGVRYSSTHRVAREGQGSWQYIRDKIERNSAASAHFDFSKGIVTLNHLSSRRKREKMVSHVRAQQHLIAEIEFEWLRQWFVQGKKHASLHPYWHRRVNFLCDSFCKLEKASCEIINLLKALSNRGPGSGDCDITLEIFDTLIELLLERKKNRLLWQERYQDKIFNSIPEAERPYTCPCLDRCEDLEGYMPENLDLLVLHLRRWRSAYVTIEKSDEPSANACTRKSKKSNAAKSGSLTKKESKHIASNWERLRANLKG